MLKKMQETLKKWSVNASVSTLGLTALMFSVMYCNGKLYEPKVPQQLLHK